MIFGVDTASFQPLGTYDPGSWECINIEDPGIAAKVERNNRDGRPTDVYVWCYSNDRNADFFRWATREAKSLGITRCWLDYEEEGREGNWRIDVWREVCAQEQVQCGLYSNDWRIVHANYLDLPYWYAGYPDPNDGTWKGGAPKASRPVQIWQFTSGGGLDRDVIWDEAWFAGWVHGQTPTPTALVQGDDDMWIAITPTDAFSVFGNLVGRHFTGDRVYAGLPADAIQYASSMQPPIPMRFIAEIEGDGIKGASKNALTGASVDLGPVLAKLDELKTPGTGPTAGQRDAVTAAVAALKSRGDIDHATADALAAAFAQQASA